MIKLKNGTEVTEEEFYSWSSRKQRLNLIGYSEETKAKIGAASKRWMSTPEAKAKISAERKSRVRTVVHKANMAKALVGRPVSVETRSKLRESALKRAPQSEESKAKRDATWARKRAEKLAQ